MKNKEKRIPKSEWGPGPWHEEPDEKTWVDSETGYPCSIRRTDVTGSLCGYVVVPKGHPAFGEVDADIDVHGGLTYARAKDDGWCFGFDTSHAWDKSPAMEALLRSLPGLSHLDHERAHEDDVYRDMAYVEKEVRSLAKQLKAMEG